MDMNQILQQIDTYFANNEGAKAEQFMLKCMKQAMVESDDASLLQLVNELLGYYRESSQVENSFILARQAVGLAEKMGLKGSIQYATTLLNVANAYRAGGRLEEALQYYAKVREIYEDKLSPNDMLVASLENNISLLYQEMGEYAKAKECLLAALPIVKENQADFEVAVTYANLAGTCIVLKELEDAYSYGTKAAEIFENMGVEDFHYGAAVAALGSYYFQKGNPSVAKVAFEQARDIMEKSFGENEYYHRLTENIEECDKAMSEPEETFEEPDTETSEESDIETLEETDTETFEEPDIETFEEPAGETFEESDTETFEEPAVETLEEPAAEAPEEPDTETSGEATVFVKGMDLCREYYETYGKPMIAEQFPEYASKIAVGLVGEGSDCFGYDDELSRDHDWGPRFYLWVTKETYQEIGQRLQLAYEQLPKEFKGHECIVSPKAKDRGGVMTISAFYKRFVQTMEWEQIDWRLVSDASLAAAVNGEVFRDDEGIFTEYREKLQKGFPEYILYLKLSESVAKFSQAGQYNYERMKQRGDTVTAQIMLADAVREAMKIEHYAEGKYPPHDKWLRLSLEELPKGVELGALLAELKDENCSMVMEQVATLLARDLYEKNLISDTDPYLDMHTAELLRKASMVLSNNRELVEKIVKLEFEAFDKVQNVGGRAECQNDWATFSIMRKSQYMTWNRTMLLQYYYDFSREYRKGHNLIEEKYGRMMESTAPEEYEKIKEHFPVLSDEKKAIIEEIVKIQVGWMEEFADKYPYLADNARSVHTKEDHLYSTSYETYLRGEISTYSDKMLELYGRYVVEYARKGRNLAFEIMENNANLYGYADLESAERFLGL